MRHLRIMEGMVTIGEDTKTEVPYEEAWTSYGRMVMAPVVSGAVSSLAFVLPIFAPHLFPDGWAAPGLYLYLGVSWLVAFVVAVPTTALVGIMTHGVFWHSGLRRPWHYVAGASVFALIGGTLLGGLKNPVFYVIWSGIVGVSGGLSFHWIAYHSRTDAAGPHQNQLSPTNPASPSA